MPKVNVYLPQELADRVRRNRISISPICQRAIERELVWKERAPSIDAELTELEAKVTTLESEMEATSKALDEKWNEGLGFLSDLLRLDAVAMREAADRGGLPADDALRALAHDFDERADRIGRH